MAEPTPARTLETATATAVGAPAAPYPARAVAWYATVVLAFLYWLSILDRFIISLLVDPIKRDLGISDMHFGILHGAAFAVAFSVFGLLAGALADRFSRRWIIFAGVSVWSLATAACGMAQSFWHMLAARVGVGAGEAVLNPCATSMITDLFPRERLTSALAVYAIGSTLGSGCAYLFGGMIVDLVSESGTFALPVIGDVRSWQAAFFIVGIPGAFLSLLLLTFPEPARRGSASQATGPDSFSWRSALRSYAALIRFMRSRARFFSFHYAGFAVASMIVVGAGTWYAAHMGRTFGWDAGRIGFTLGVTLVVAGVVGKLLCGFAVDAMFRRGVHDAQLRWYAASLAAATPFGLVAFTSSHPWVFLGAFSLYVTLLTPLPACASAALNLVTPNELRGTGVAFFASTAGLIGAGTGPVLIAAISDRFFGGDASIGLGVAAMIAVCCPLSAVLLACGFRAMREAIARAERALETR
jgi:MFS family permease